MIDSTLDPRSRRPLSTPGAGRVARFLTALLAVATLLFGASVAVAAEPRLTSDNVSRFLDSLPDFEALGQKYGQETRRESRKQARKMPHGAAGYAGMSADEAMAMAAPSEAELERAASPFSSSIPEMRASNGWNDMLATVKRHGFSSVEEWAAVGDRAMRAFAAAQMKREMPEIDAQMAEMQKSLAQSGMSKKQQEAMMQMVNSSRQTMQTFQDVPEADKKAVAPHLDRFEALSRSGMRDARRSR